jgi:uncharacterized protein (TIGR02996 family)
MGERKVPEPFVVEPWWDRFGATAVARLRSIAQNPDDAKPRLALADFLEKAGEVDRAEFIRLQVEQMPFRQGQVRWDIQKWTLREQELLDQHEKEWLAGLPEGLEWFFWGGLVEGVVVWSVADWQQAVGVVDVRRVVWRRRGSLFLEHTQLLAGLVALDLKDNGIGDAGAEALAQSPHLTNLRVLNLGYNWIGDAGARALAQSPHLTNLRELNLSSSWIREAGAEALAQSPHLTNLRVLNLSYNGIGDAGAEALAQSPHLTNLRVLNLEFNEIGDAGAVALAYPHLTNLRELNLSANGIGDAGAEALAQSPHLTNLRVLDLEENGIGDAGAEALAQSPHLTNLRVLNLEFNEIGDAGAAALKNSPYLRRCYISTWLSLAFCSFFQITLPPLDPDDWRWPFAGIIMSMSAFFHTRRWC